MVMERVNDPSASPQADEPSDEAQWALTTGRTLQDRGDTDGAVTWYRRAAEQGHTSAQVMYGRRPRCKRNLTVQRSVRVQPCIRPSSAAAMAAGPDVIR